MITYLQSLIICLNSSSMVSIMPPSCTTPTLVILNPTPIIVQTRSPSPLPRSLLLSLPQLYPLNSLLQIYLPSFTSKLTFISNLFFSLSLHLLALTRPPPDDSASLVTLSGTGCTFTHIIHPSPNVIMEWEVGILLAPQCHVQTPSSSEVHSIQTYHTIDSVSYYLPTPRTPSFVLLGVQCSADGLSMPSPTLTLENFEYTYWCYFQHPNLLVFQFTIFSSTWGYLA